MAQFQYTAEWFERHTRYAEEVTIPANLAKYLIIALQRDIERAQSYAEAEWSTLSTSRIEKLARNMKLRHAAVSDLAQALSDADWRNSPEYLDKNI